MRLYSASGYGLVVKRVLAKDESGVRFSLSAPKDKAPSQRALCRVYMLKTGDKGVGTGDKGHTYKSLIKGKYAKYQANITLF